MMVDREKVIKGLKCCAHNIDYGCNECPYFSECFPGYDRFTRLATDALALLKEEEPKIVVELGGDSDWSFKFGRCPSCGEALMNANKYKMTLFCQYCGQAVKWE